MSEQDHLDKKKTVALEDNDTRPAQSVNETQKIVPWVVEFRVIGTPYMVRVPMGDNLIIGRSDAERGIVPQIDLSEYDALNRGVSRRHARLIAGDNRVTIEDIGSSNGTFVNGTQLAVLTPERIRDSDRITLGKLELQVHFIVKPSINDQTLHGTGNEIEIERIASGEHLLVVDESREVCHVIRHVALESGFQVTIAHNMNDAIRCLDTEKPDAIMSELMLPDGSGLHVLNYARRERAIPAVVLSAAGGGFRMGQAVDAGVDMFLLKPVAVDELMQGLEQILDLMRRKE